MYKATIVRVRILVSIVAICASITAGLISNDIASGQIKDRSVADVNIDLGVPTPPQYQIFDIGIVATGDTASQGFGVSTGGVGVGRSVRTGGAQAFSWTQAGGIVGLPNIAGRAFCVSNGANNAGAIAGTCAASLFGTSRLPVI